MTNKQPYKVYINKANENWIIDRVRKEWIKYKNPHTNFKQLADIIWIISPWTWSRDNFEKYKSKKNKLTKGPINFFKCLIIKLLL